MKNSDSRKEKAKRKVSSPEMGDRFREYREFYGKSLGRKVSQEEFIKHLEGFDSDAKYSISKYENGVNITLDILLKYVERSGWDIDYFIGRQECKHRPTADIIEELPLCENTVEKLRDLKRDYLMISESGVETEIDWTIWTAIITEIAVNTIISSYESGGKNDELMLCVERLLPAYRTLKKMGQDRPKKQEDRTRRSMKHGKEWTDAMREVDNMKREIGALLSGAICDQIRMKVLEQEEGENDGE